ncbi:prepilin-type N-terminal cleavage/methylation domain-containing protein [Pseudomonas sp. OIL-1]|uniref:prepilin-type N-terminal cleavage/methylation domain-containing protein n=1 Tax=Pseudomonas sp. OIL-1 TaxID=2706126 RepID=UPI0013A71EEC|nr:PilW family protein [Pseudomonas sp. OIL-1]QIB49635.1 hypothetical protein G3M63_00260 [Pseudomonas sp. OIL-1]
MSTTIRLSIRQQGLSLIELMVALLLSTLLILGITQLYIDNKRNYVFQQGQSDNIENARYTLMLFEEELYRTGYRSRPDDSYENVFRAASTDNCTFKLGEVITFDGEKQLLCLRYQPNLETIRSCDGTALTGGDGPYDVNVSPVITEIQIAGNSLQCNGVPLVDNLVDIKLLFGTSDGTARETQEFKTTPAATDRIRSVRYAALLKSRSQNLADSNSNTAYQAWRSKWYGESDASTPDRALYLTAESTLALRNLSR